MWTVLVVCNLVGGIFAQDSVFNDNNDEEKLEPSRIVASKHQMTIRSAEGDMKMGTDSGDHFRAEERTKNNEVKGIYSWVDPTGNAHTVVYNSGKSGYKTVPLASSGITLPKFPNSLYGNIESRTNDVKEEPELYTPPGMRGSGPIKDTQVDGEFVVITADGENQTEVTENPIVEVDDDENVQGGTLINLPDLPGGLQIEIGTPVAISKPSVAAVAGDKGTAHTNPSSQAFVGPGGVAIAMPSAQAAVGAQGIALSQPVAASSAGLGGVAIAGGTSVASAGLENSVHQLIYKSSNTTFKNGMPTVFIQPIVYNYYNTQPMYYPLQGMYPYQKTGNFQIPSKNAILPPRPYPYAHTNFVKPTTQEVTKESRTDTQYSPVPKPNFFYNNAFPKKTLDAYSANSYEAFKQQSH